MPVTEFWKMLFSNKLIIFISLLPVTNSRSLKVGILIPSDWQTQTGVGVKDTVENACKIGVNYLPTGYNISVIWGCNACDEQDSVISSFRLYQDEMVDVFISPYLEDASETVSLLTSYWKRPQLSWTPIHQNAPQDGRNAIRNTLISTASTHRAVFRAIEQVLKHFHWSKLTVLYEESNCGWSTADLISYGWTDVEQPTIYNIDLSSTVNITDTLQVTREKSTAILVCISPKNLKKLSFVAERLGMTSGNYVYLFYSMALTLQSRYHDIAETCNRFLPSVIQIVNHMVPSSSHQKMSLGKIYSKNNVKNLEEYLPFLYDAILMWSIAFGDKLNQGSINLSQDEFLQYLQKRRLNDSKLLTSPIEYDSEGIRKPRFCILHQQNEKSEMVGMVTEEYYHVSEIQEWPSGTLPLECNENQDDTGVVIASIMGTLLTIVIILLIVFLFKKFRPPSEEASRLWTVHGPELKLRKDRLTKITPTVSNTLTSNNNNKHLSKRRRLTRMETRATLGFGSTLSLDKGQLFAQIGQYKGSIVAVKPLQGRSVRLTDITIEDLNIIKELQHDNLNLFVGARLDNNTGFILYKYCAKGSLQDVLDNDDIKLDWNFKMSFAIDISKGMEYMHKCPLKSNGNLKSSNCVIDSRWVVKITDFGALSTNEIQVMDEQQHGKRLLWTSPELLRKHKPPKKGSQKGDVYSFSIILQEIFLRCSPFFYNNLTYKDIIKRVKASENPAYRPLIPADSSLIDDCVLLMKSCWNEDPPLRPDFREIRKQLVQLNGGKKVNIMDNMIQLLEAYSNNLETLVAERTDELAREKLKTETLLYQMLPPGVADQLKIGRCVVPESFDEVSIFFSDIVGFTQIASNSEPLQVVDLLNDLYTTFDGIIAKHDVYKVETIGDAYMCVSGVPSRNEKRHSAEIANMALNLISAVDTFRIRHLPEERLLLRVGLHTGSCAAGVVGQIMPRYCLFGDTVNMASRMESLGKALHIHISLEMNEALEALDEGFLTVQRGFIPVKGKGLQRTFWLVGKRSYHKHLPDSMLRFHQAEAVDSRATTPSVNSLGVGGYDDNMYTGLLRKPSITNNSSISLNSITSDYRSDVVNNELLSVDEPFRFEYNRDSVLSLVSSDEDDVTKKNIPRIELTELP